MYFCTSSRLTNRCLYTRPSEHASTDKKSEIYKHINSCEQFKEETNLLQLGTDVPCTKQFELQHWSQHWSKGEVIRSVYSLKATSCFSINFQVVTNNNQYNFTKFASNLLLYEKKDKKQKAIVTDQWLSLQRIFRCVLIFLHSDWSRFAVSEVIVTSQ